MPQAIGERTDTWSGLNSSYSSILIEQPQLCTVEQCVKAAQLHNQAIADKSQGAVDG